MCWVSAPLVWRAPPKFVAPEGGIWPVPQSPDLIAFAAYFCFAGSRSSGHAPSCRSIVPCFSICPLADFWGCDCRQTLFSHAMALPNMVVVALYMPGLSRLISSAKFLFSWPRLSRCPGLSPVLASSSNVSLDQGPRSTGRAITIPLLLTFRPELWSWSSLSAKIAFRARPAILRPRPEIPAGAVN